MKLNPNAPLYTFRDKRFYFLRFTITREKQLLETGTIGQGSLLRILVGYTTRELTTASIVQSIILYRARRYGDLAAPRMFSIERRRPARNSVRLIRNLREKMR